MMEDFKSIVCFLYFDSFCKENSLKSVLLYPHKFHTDNAIGF